MYKFVPSTNSTAMPPLEPLNTLSSLCIHCLDVWHYHTAATRGFPDIVMGLTKELQRLLDLHHALHHRNQLGGVVQRSVLGSKQEEGKTHI